MIFHQILYPDLGCASYFLADGDQGVVVDPRFEIEPYLRLAAREGVQIEHVLDTHTHADHVSGRERLAGRTGARAYGPAQAVEQASNGTRPTAAELHDGDTLAVGGLRLRALATPGHRPEHLSILVSDTSRGSDPWLILTGDSLLVGDLARPDLAVEARAGAEDLHRSLAKLIDLGDHVELWPAHVGGSLCGGAGLSSKTSSTIGYERRHNPLLGVQRTAFVDELVRDLPPRPPNVARIVALNRVRTPAEPQAPAELDAGALDREIQAGAQIVDGRPPDAFDDGHLAGAINLPPGRSQGTRAGWVLDPEDRLVVVGADHEHARRIAQALHAVGLWNITGLAAASIERWQAGGLAVDRAASWDVATLAERLGDPSLRLIDVREREEWQSGHVPGSHTLPLDQLNQPGLAALAQANGNGHTDTLAVACAGGGRAAFAASVIRRAGHANVVRVTGGGIGNLSDHGVTLQSGE